MKKLISIILIISFLFTLSSCANTEKPDWQEHLDLGQKYLLDGDYEQAIIEFNKVIEIEPKNVDAYLGLAEAYVAEGDYDSAISVLGQGYAETENQALQDRINELREMAAEQTEAVTTVTETASEVNTIHKSGAQIIKQVSRGGCHDAAITEDGSLYMWGLNVQGGLGNGTAVSSFTPIKIMDNVVSVSLGYEHSAAITTDGSLYMWGGNNGGQLGNEISGGKYNEYDEGIDSNIPIKIMDNVVSVSLESNHSFAITTDGSLYMWGQNFFRQLVDGNISDYSEQIDSNIPIKIMDNVVSISLGELHCAAVTDDGSLYMWGDNDCGELGDGTTEDRNAPIKLLKESNIPNKIMDNVIYASVGGRHSAAITDDGSLYTWGDNCFGQLGNGKSGGVSDLYDDGIDSKVPIKIMDNVAYVSLGQYHSAAITTDGSLYMWGNNYFGQFGNETNGGNIDSYDERIDSNTPIKIMDNVVSVSLGYEHSAAITTDGSLYLWGANSYGWYYDPTKIEIPAE